MIPIKPLPFAPKLQNPPWPRRKRSSLTVISGFRGYGGIVLCADVLEVVGGYAKKSVDKIVSGHSPNGQFNFAIGGAGTGPYIDMLMRELVPCLANSMHDIEAICKTLSDCLAEFYSKHVWPRGSGADKVEMQFLASIQPTAPGEPKLLHIMDTAVNEVQGLYHSIGIGGYLADYVLESILNGGGGREHLVAVAHYMLTEVNENVDGCGNGYAIYFFGDDGITDFDSDLFTHDDQKDIKNILKWSFQAMTDVGDKPGHGFTVERLGELLAEERKSRADAHTARLTKRAAMRAFLEKSRAK